MQKENSFSACIICHPSYIRFLDGCLESIAKAQSQHENVVSIRVLLSNYSNNAGALSGYLKIIEKYNKILNISGYSEPQKLTIAQARNYLIRKSEEDWLIFWDSDIKVSSQYFKNLSKSLSKISDPKTVAMASGIEPWGETFWGKFEFFMDLFAYYGKVQGFNCLNFNFDNYYSNKKYYLGSVLKYQGKPCLYLQGFNQIIKASAFRELNSFDENFWGAEDREFSARLITNGYKIIFSPELSVEHYYGFTLIDIFKRKYAHGYYSAMFRRKYEMIAPETYTRGLRKWSKYSMTLIFIPTTFRKRASAILYYHFSFIMYFLGSVKFHLKRLMYKEILYSDYSFTKNV